MTERRARLPYLDSQTKVAQKDCSLWFERRHRGPGLKPNQVYSYPAKRWKKRPRFNPIMDPHFDAVSDKGYNTRPRRPAKMSSYNEDYLEAHLMNENSNDSNTLSTLNASVLDVDNDIVENESIGVSSSHNDNEDDDDFDEEYETGRSKKKGKRSSRSGTNTRSKKIDFGDDKDKPYHCMYCGKRYKNKAGLQYHLQHIHRDEVEAEDEYKPSASPATSVMNQDAASPITTFQSSRSATMNVQKDESGGDSATVGGEVEATTAENATLSTAQQASSSAGGARSGGEGEAVGLSSSRAKRGKAVEGSKRHPRQSNDYCDFCLGDAYENKKTGTSEQLVSCADCGRSAHPTCLQFTAIMTANVKKYSWQCIECKSCHVCGTSDNDDQLLFCDDCDRGYHMYCLTPRMENPPEGAWICSLCEADKKAAAAASSSSTTCTPTPTASSTTTTTAAAATTLNL